MHAARLTKQLMSSKQIITLAILAILMVLVAVGMGRWSEQINPDGIAMNPVTESTDVAADNSTDAEPRDAYTFGVSLGLLATGFLYCCIAIGLLIHARSKGKPAGKFIYWVAGFAGLGFALSYLVDDYFY